MYECLYVVRKDIILACKPSCTHDDDGHYGPDDDDNHDSDDYGDHDYDDDDDDHVDNNDVDDNGNILPKSIHAQKQMQTTTLWQTFMHIRSYIT